MVESYNIPLKEDLQNATISNDLDKDAINSFTKNINQSDNSFSKQKLTISTFIYIMNYYCNIFDNKTLTKYVVIQEHPGAGKKNYILYSTLYAIYKGLNVVTTVIMSKQALQLGSIHQHIMLFISTEEKASPFRKEELSIT